MSETVCCRTCFSTQMHSYSPLTEQFIKQLEECVPIKVIPEHTPFTVVICYECSRVLTDFLQFKAKCIELEPLFFKYCEDQIKPSNCLELTINEVDNDVEFKTEIDEKQHFDEFEHDNTIESSVEKNLKNSNNRCDQCNKVYRSGKLLNKHICHKLRKSPNNRDTLNGNSTLKCVTCAKLFRSKEGLSIHIKSKHTTNLPYECQYLNCKKNFATYGLLAKHCKKGHVNYTAPHACNECTWRFYDVRMLDKHRIYEHCQNCPSCGLHRNDTKNYLDHVRRCLKGQFKDPQKCQICGRTYRHLKSLSTHMTQKHSERDKRKVCLTCGKRVYDIKNHERKHIDRPRDKRFKCGICGELFSTRILVIEHRKATHAQDVIKQERKFECDVCRKRYFTKGTLKKHKINTHGTEFGYRCDACGKGFNSADWLKVHVKRSHTNERKYACVYCSRRFFTHAEVKKHMRFHTGERPYVCTMCSKAFSRSDSLKLHMLNHP